MVAYRVAWWITKFPDTTILYCSATADVAEKQLKFIKDLLTSDTYRYYWPEMVNPSENQRERWTAEEFSVDHPLRKQEGVRDPTVKAVGITANTTGLHCKVAVLDDVVVPGNAYSSQGREDVRRFYSQLSSIETTGAKEWAVGTRYHPADLYRDMADMREEFVDPATGEWIERPVYEVFERAVERDGEFLWPKQRRYDGKTFGFDERELARKKAKYLDVTQFYSQYYNNPNSPETAAIAKDRFQYYDRSRLRYISGSWYLDDEMLLVYAGIDFAFSLSTSADFTAIVVIGIDSSRRIYVLDIDRFKTNRISVMYDHVLSLYRKWRFRRLRAEVSVGQGVIVNQFRDYMREHEISFSIDEHRPATNRSKDERINAVLEPMYTNMSIWHYKGGNCQTLEEELMLAHPEHDDVKDCLASVVETAKPPANRRRSREQRTDSIYSSRFGGVAYQ